MIILKHIYISGALMATKDLNNARKLYEFAESICLEKGHIAYVPHKHTDPELNTKVNPLEVFDIDSHKIITARGIIAFANEPSFGVGLEIMLAVQNNIPVLCLHQNHIKISRYLRGFLMKHNYDDAVLYQDETDLAQKISTWLIETYGNISASKTASNF